MEIAIDDISVKDKDVSVVWTFHQYHLLSCRNFINYWIPWHRASNMSCTVFHLSEKFCVQWTS